MEFAEFLHLVQRVVTVGIGDAVEAAARASVTGDIERIECPEKALRTGDFGGDFFDDRGLRSIERRRRDPHQSFVALVASDQAALGVSCQRDPGTEFVAWHRKKSLNFKALRHGKGWAGWIGGRGGSG